ncbi:hypothetical protein ACHAWF_014380 [Thalassiosira exigua]
MAKKMIWQAAAAAAAADGNKRRRTPPPAPAGDVLLDDFPDALLAGIASFLAGPSRVLFSVAAASSTSTTASASLERSRAMLAASPGCDDEQWKVIDFLKFGEGVAQKITDDDLGRILLCADAVHRVETLKLAGCVNIFGRGLKPLRGSSVLKHVDLSLVGPHTSPIIRPEPMISEDVVLPILDSIMVADDSSLEFLCFPKKWRERRNFRLGDFITRYNLFLENRYLQCDSVFGTMLKRCGTVCQDSDADIQGQRMPWVVQYASDFPQFEKRFLIRKYGMQRYTCHKCFRRTCYDCSLADYGMSRALIHQCVKCEKNYCASCAIGETCNACDDFICPDCKHGQGGEYFIECPSCEGDTCKFCVETCKGCEKVGCRSIACEMVHCHCCSKSHCRGCFNGEEFSVELCHHCENTLCNSCRYSSCTKDLVQACQGCLDKVGVHFPRPNQSPFVIFSNSIEYGIFSPILQFNPEHSRGPTSLDRAYCRKGRIIMKNYKALSEHKRAICDMKAKHDVKRYQRDLSTFEQIHGKIVSPTASFLYANSVRSEFRSDYPGADSKMAEDSIQQHFALLPEEERSYWNHQAMMHKQRSLSAADNEQALRKVWIGASRLHSLIHHVQRYDIDLHTIFTTITCEITAFFINWI